MDQDRFFSFKNLAINYLCLYAVIYPLFAHFLMEEGGTGGVGSVPVHLFQFSAFIAFCGIAEFGKENSRRGVDIWMVASFYFACEAMFLAVFFSEDAKIVEIAYAARFILWFLFASIVTRKSLGLRNLEKLSFSFLVGTFFQGLLAIWAFKTQSVGSIYKEVYATTGGANVSGKTIVIFVILGIFLACYWSLTCRRGRWIFIPPILIGTLVILFSYNRASQLSFAIVLLLDAFWLIRSRKLRTFFVLGVTAIVVVLFLSSSLGEPFLLRWQRIRFDGGSGRITLVRAALESLANPESMRSLLFGRGNYQTRLLMFRACGAYIGTHSDLFDFLTMYGLIGGGFYALIAFKILTLGKGLPRRSIEYLCVRSSVVFIILTGLMTGSFQATYAFVMLFTICQYWLERGKLFYGDDGETSLEAPLFFPCSEFESDEFDEQQDEQELFQSFSRTISGDQPKNDESSAFDGENVSEKDNVDIQSEKCSVMDFYDSEDKNNTEEDAIDSRGFDFKTTFSVTDLTVGFDSPFIGVDGQSRVGIRSISKDCNLNDRRELSPDRAGERLHKDDSNKED